MTIRAWTDGVWTVDMPHKVMGIPVGGRATILRLSDGRLAFVSPVRLEDDDVAAIRALGEVAFVVAPNLLHYRFVSDAKEHFPSARVLGAPGLRSKLPSLPIDGDLDGKSLPGLEQHRVGGMPSLGEIALRAGDTLVLTDLCFNVRATSSWLYRLYLRRGGAFGRLAMTPISRRMIADGTAFAASRDVLVGWGCERVIVTHGDVLESGGQAALAEALS